MGHKVGGVRRQNVSLSLLVTLIMGLMTHLPCHSESRKGLAHARQPMVDNVTEGAVSLRKSTSLRKMDKEGADLGSATNHMRSLSCHGKEKVAVMGIDSEKRP